MSTLQVEAVCWGVAGRAIVDQVTMTVQKGEFVGLVGPNGSGKSSLLRTIYRVLAPTAGRITLDGANVWQMETRRAAQHTAVVAQERASDFDFTVEEMVMMGRTPHKGMFDHDTAEDYALIAHCLRQVKMTEFRNRRFQTLSGGEKQRVLMARALAQQPQFLVLDEPTNHLDIRYQLELLSLVKQLGVTTIAALHDLNLAAQYCDRIFMLHEGCVVAFGTPAEVLQPERIREVYQVEADVQYHPRTGQLQITFFPLEVPVATTAFA